MSGEEVIDRDMRVMNDILTADEEVFDLERVFGEVKPSGAGDILAVDAAPAEAVD